MPDLGPHAVFILAAYAVTFLAVAALAAFIVDDDRRQQRLLAELEARLRALPKAPTHSQSGSDSTSSASPARTVLLSSTMAMRVLIGGASKAV